jgi:CRP-like cAMP-binding protein
MSSNAKVAQLRRVPFLRPKSDSELAELGHLVDEVTVPAQHVLMREGSAGREMFFVVDGWAEVCRDGASLAAVGPGEVIGELSLLDNEPRSATVVAKTPMRLLVLGAAAFPALADQPSVGQGLATQLARRLRNVEERL